MKPIAKLAIAALLSGTALSGVQAATHPETGEELAADQTFTYRLLDDISSFDPQVVEDVDGSSVSRDLFEGLMNQDEDGNLVPGVATGYEVSDDKLTYTFTLRDTAVWSNGDPVVAGDFVYGWRRAADPATASPYQW
ncbi:MAG: oligopeptide ABC transporter substrate-binding protein OppA, partial [Rhodobacteraceae bacterium]|nr:oligopeptide ABC transporter substrate-binding protein OppA [Paracoccaceae bacterium]